MRIAWTGEPGSAGADGVPGIAYQLRSGLARRGHTIDVYFPLLERSAPDPSGEGLAGVELHPLRTGWSWEHWYARSSILVFLTVSALRSVAVLVVAAAVMRTHRRRPYDVIFQMSQLEQAFPKGRSRRPPVVLHPCTLARQEAVWHWRERRVALRGEPWFRFAAIQAMLLVRGLLQPRSARSADLVLGPSDRFGTLAAKALGIDRSTIRTLRHPVDVARFEPSAEPNDELPYELLFVGHLSARKGLELVVDLSHRLDDLAGEVRITVVGGPRLWSDYSHLLERANPRVLRALGGLYPEQLIPVMRQADAVVVPSRFEPGSIVTGEALACGLPVIASDAVGPSEILDDSCGRVFADGNPAALEAATRGVLDALHVNRRAFTPAARARAVEQLSTDIIVAELEALLLELLERDSGIGNTR